MQVPHAARRASELGQIDLTDDERAALKSLFQDQASQSTESREPLQRAVARLVAEVNSLGGAVSAVEAEARVEVRKERRKWLDRAGITAVFLLPLMIFSFRGAEISVSTDDGSVMHVRKSWWGLSRKETEIRWMQPPGYRAPYWMAKNSRGQWYPFLLEPIDESE